MRHFTCMLLAAMSLTVAVFPVAGQQIESTPPALETGRQARLFDRHTVRMGETGFSIARGYAISPMTLAEDNPGIDLTRLRVGQVMFIRKRERGKSDLAKVAREWEKMVNEKAAKSETAAVDRTQNIVPADQLPADTLWSALGDPDGSGFNYRRNGVGRRGLRDFGSGKEGPAHIALMLPFNQGTTDFTDFHKGALLALEDLKAKGRSAIVTIYNSGRSTETVRNIVSSADFADTDLIIGPVYEDEMEPAVRFGEFFGVPVVSPFIPALKSLNSETLYQMAPDPAAKYDKLRPLLAGDANIIVISSGTNDDAEFRREIEAELDGHNYSRFVIGGGGGIASLIDWERPNVLIVLAGNELTVNKALSDIYSSYFNASARRSSRGADISVVGTSKWVGYGSFVSKDLFFKLGVKFVTNYYIDRSNRETRLFEARYLDVYNDLPSKAAFRGYDAVALFAGALFESGFSFADRLERVGSAPLGTPYRFTRGVNGESRHVNNQWTLVSFTNDYNIITQ